MGSFLVGDQFCIPQKLLDYEILSESCHISEVDVGTELFIVGEDVMQYTPCNIVGFVHSN